MSKPQDYPWIQYRSEAGILIDKFYTLYFQVRVVLERYSEKKKISNTQFSSVSATKSFTVSYFDMFEFKNLKYNALRVNTSELLVEIE